MGEFGEGDGQVPRVHQQALEEEVLLGDTPRNHIAPDMCSDSLVDDSIEQV